MPTDPEAQPAPAPAAPAPSPTTTLAKPVALVTPEILASLRRGDRAGFIAALGVLPTSEALVLRSALDRVTNIAIELRRENVAVIGSHEAFVRKTPQGSLYQVIQPVRLSLAAKTLYQIPIRKCFKAGTDEVVGRSYRGATEWREIPQRNAEVTYPGFLQINAVAGCAVGQPPTVNVDGEPKTNPYVERQKTAGGRLGDIVRVVIGVVVVGPAPATGNPVVVNYTLDYDPAKDLHHMLSAVADKHPEDCYLVDEADVKPEPGWKFTPVYGGVGYFYNLRTEAIREVYADFVNLLQNAGKKVQTIARRNAMKSHPAIAIHTVEVDKDGRAVVPVVGWAGEEAAMGKWRDLCDKLARGAAIDEHVVVDLDPEVYNPEVHQSGEADVDNRAQRESVRVVSEDDADRQRLVEQIDKGIAMLSPKQIASLDYSPDAPIATLRDVYDRVNALLDAE